jgi:hypothetical protein
MRVGGRAWRADGAMLLEGIGLWTDILRLNPDLAASSGEFAQLVRGTD